MLLREEISVATDETTSSLETKLTPVGARLLLDTIRGMKEGQIADRPQQDADATYVPQLEEAEDRILHAFEDALESADNDVRVLLAVEMPKVRQRRRISAKEPVKITE